MGKFECDVKVASDGSDCGRQQSEVCGRCAREYVRTAMAPLSYSSRYFHVQFKLENPFTKLQMLVIH